MTFSDYLSDIFSPAFKAVGQWFQQLLDKCGFFGVFLSMVVLSIAFAALVMPFLKFGGMQIARSGQSRDEYYRNRRASEQRRNEYNKRNRERNMKL